MLNLSDEQTQQSNVAGPSLTPLLDVMLLLLIFFLLASVFAQPTLDVDLPEASNSESSVEQNEILSISVSPNGEIFINKTLVSLKDLQGRIEEALSHEAEMPVLVRADRQSAFEHFVNVMDAVKGAGAKQLIIETQNAPREREQ
jgi:biopolymer transport protein ExbD